jgi:GH43 family beta-xylosidase
MISTPTYDWEKIGDPDVNEGPQIIKNAAGKVFLVYSASGCWTDDYSLGLLTLKTGGDPMNAADWTKTPTPVFTKNPSSSAYGPGHNSFFKSPNGTEDWILYHANPASGQQCGNSRSPRMQKFTWNADGTPSFGSPASINTPITRPSGE